MIKNDDLGNRMKGYESVTKNKLMRRTPAIIRLDGKAFHTYTKKITSQNDPSLFDGPFSEYLHQTMMATCLGLFKEVQNVELVYTQSDEISILLRDWDKFKTEQWFDAQIQKIVSVSASMATAFFNYNISLFIPDLAPQSYKDLAFFDSRVYNIPKEEVNNYFIWRQQDATRNSVQMLGQFYFSHKQMSGLSNNKVQEKLLLEHGVNWNNRSVWEKRGACIYRQRILDQPNFLIDEDIPIFAKERDYVEKHLLVGENNGKI